MAPLGRFVEIGKRDLVQNKSLEMAKFEQSVTFAAVILMTVSDLQSTFFRDLLARVVDCCYWCATPGDRYYDLPHIRVSEDLATHAKAVPVPLRDPFTSIDASYLITGGTGGVGSSIARWMAKEEAKNITLASRRGMGAHGPVQELVKEVNDYGVKVAVCQCDVFKEDGVARLVKQMTMRMLPIRGVIHGAMAVYVSSIAALYYSTLLKIASRTSFSKGATSMIGTKLSSPELKVPGICTTNCLKRTLISSSC